MTNCRQPAIYGTSNIARHLGITRAAAKKLIAAQTIETFEVDGRTCATHAELDRYEGRLAGWETEGGACA